MASLQTQVRALAGTSTNELQWVNDGIRVVIDRVLSIDPGSAYLFTQNLSGGNSGANVTERQHVVSVAVGSKSATEIPASKRFVAAEATSLQKATADYPQYYFLNQKLFVIPSGDFSYSAVDYTTLANLNGTTISNFPTSLIPTVVNYAAMKSLNEKMVGYTGLSGLSLTLPSVPPQPSLVFSVTDTITAVNTAEITNVSLPEFVSVADPNISTLDLSSFNVPVTPDAPSFTYNDASLQKAFASLSVQFSTSAPTYTAPNMKPIDFTKISSLIEDDEDIELAQIKLSEEQVKVSEFSAEVQDSVNAFNKENTEYQIQYQKSVQEFESQVNQRIQEMSISSNIDLQNKAKSLEKEVSEYSSKLQRYTQDLQRYQADVSKSVQEWTLNNLQYKFAKYQTDINENLNEYQAKVGSTLQKYSADISKLGTITQTEANKLGANLQKDSAKNNVELQKFNSALQDFSQQSQVYISEFNSKMQKSQIEYQWYEKQYAIVQQQYEKGFEPFIIRRQQDGEQSRIRS
tara:strand:+ start:5396 stop:6949 length:1554 start_codon:yes stop_codon:yes gene_type:complete